MPVVSVSASGEFEPVVSMCLLSIIKITYLPIVRVLVLSACVSVLVMSVELASVSVLVVWSVCRH